MNVQGCACGCVCVCVCVCVVQEKAMAQRIKASQKYTIWTISQGIKEIEEAFAFCLAGRSGHIGSSITEKMVG